MVRGCCIFRRSCSSIDWHTVLVVLGGIIASCGSNRSNFSSIVVNIFPTNGTVCRNVGRIDALWNCECDNWEKRQYCFEGYHFVFSIVGVSTADEGLLLSLCLNLRLWVYRYRWCLLR